MCKKKSRRDHTGADFCHGDRPPDAVHAKKDGQDQDGGSLKDQGPQEGDGGGHRSVAEGSKKRRTKSGRGSSKWIMQYAYKDNMSI